MTKVPTHLLHKPIYAVTNYPEADGIYKEGTDVQCLSLGKAQWSKNEFVPSVKVLRHTGKKWSRQSEETTLTRAMDLATLILKVFGNIHEGKSLEFSPDIFGNKLKIEQVKYSNPEKEKDLLSGLQTFLADKNNLNDFLAHAKLLKEAVNDLSL